MLFCGAYLSQSPWRNGLAHWTSNSKVVGSSPTGDVFLLIFFSYLKLFFFLFFSMLKLKSCEMEIIKVHLLLLWCLQM